MRLHKKQILLIKSLLLFCILINSCATILAQDKALYFSKLGIEQGLESNVVNSVVQDETGFVWIGTQEGVCRYDGYKFLNFRSEIDEHSISSDRISTLLIDGEYLWVGTWEGLCQINTRTLGVKRINTGSVKTIRCLAKGKGSDIYIGTSEGLMVYNSERNDYLFYTSENSALSHNTIRSLFTSNNGDIWVGTYNGLNRLRKGTFLNFDLKGTYKPQLKNNLILDIKPVSANNDSILWVGTETGLCRFNTLTGLYSHYNLRNTNLSNEVIKCIFRQDNELWLGTDFGLNIFNPNTKQIRSYYHHPLVNFSIANNTVWDIFGDKNGVLWFVTSNGISLLKLAEGVFQIKEELFGFGPETAGNQVRDILTSSDGTIWLATIHGVIAEANHKQNRQLFTAEGKQHPILLNNVYALALDKPGNIWIGTAGGINVYDPIARKMYAISATKDNGLKSNYIHSFATLPNGEIWVSAWEGGLYRIVGNFRSNSSLQFKEMDRDGSGKIIATTHGILYAQQWKVSSFDTKTFEKKTFKKVSDILNGKRISCVSKLHQGVLYIGSHSQIFGYNIEADSAFHVATCSGVGNLQSIEIDHRGNIWVSTTNAILKIDIKTKNTISLPLPPSSPLNGFQGYCSATDSTGNIYFGGDNGYVSINPSKVNSLTRSYQTLISGLLVNEELANPSNKIGGLSKHISLTQHIELPYNQNSLRFYFSTLDFFRPELSSFQYKLARYDDNWRSTSNGTNFATYAKLPPGKYELFVKNQHENTPNSAITKLLTIHITPPWWWTNTFKFLYLLAILALIFTLFSVYNYRQKLRAELKLSQLEKQHAEELMHAKLKFFTNISHEFRTPLSLIIPPISQILKSGEIEGTNQKMLQLASKNAQRLLRLVTQLLDFRTMENRPLQLIIEPSDVVSLAREVFESFTDLAARNEINYVFESPIQERVLTIDRDKIEQILYNLLSNAFKYTPVNGNIKLAITTAGNALKIYVKDNGTGISEADQAHVFERFYQTSNTQTHKTGSGIGLTLVAEYARLHNGSVNLESTLNQGSTFTLELPVNSPAPLATQASQNPTIETNTTTPQKSEQKETQQATDSNLPKLLIVDDNEDILDYIQLNLHTKYQLTRATNGQEAYDLALKIRPQLILSDVMMPILDGIELCKLLKANPKTLNTPIILLTAQSMNSQKVEAINTGADLHITKPFEIDYLISCIESLFRREQQLTQYIKQNLLILPQGQVETDKNQDELFLKKVMSIIERNMGESTFSVEVLSNEIGISTTHLYRRLKALTGKSTNEIIKNYRLQTAAQKLLNREGNVTEVMYAVGFSSLSSFSKSFSAQHGCSPSEFLRKNEQ